MRVRRDVNDGDSVYDIQGDQASRAFDWARDVPTVVARLPYSPRYCKSVLKAMTELGLFPVRPTPETLAAARQASRETPAHEMALRVAASLATSKPDDATTPDQWQ